MLCPQCTALCCVWGWLKIELFSFGFTKLSLHMEITSSFVLLAGCRMMGSFILWMGQSASGINQRECNQVKNAACRTSSQSLEKPNPKLNLLKCCCKKIPGQKNKTYGVQDYEKYSIFLEFFSSPILTNTRIFNSR